jgi:hypothetical protein
VPSDYRIGTQCHRRCHGRTLGLAADAIIALPAPADLAALGILAKAALISSVISSFVG